MEVNDQKQRDNFWQVLDLWSILSMSEWICFSIDRNYSLSERRKENEKANVDSSPPGYQQPAAGRLWRRNRDNGSRG
jgi:hypothetical protein